MILFSLLDIFSNTFDKSSESLSSFSLDVGSNFLILVVYVFPYSIWTLHSLLPKLVAGNFNLDETLSTSNAHSLESILDSITYLSSFNLINIFYKITKFI